MMTHHYNTYLFEQYVHNYLITDGMCSAEDDTVK